MCLPKQVWEWTPRKQSTRRKIRGRLRRCWRAENWSREIAQTENYGNYDAALDKPVKNVFI